jgi:hypothetical protein
VSLRDTFTDPLGDASLTARPPRELIESYNARLVKGSLVSVIVNGAPQGVNLIQSVTRRIDRNGVSFDVECQSVLATPYEASANPDYAFSSKTDTPISAVVLDIMRPFGFEEVFINAEDDVPARMGKALKHTGGKLFVEALKHQDCQVQEGETAYGVVDRIVNRLGLILRVDVAGRLLLVRPRYDQDAAYTLVHDFLNTHRGDHMLDGIEIRDTNKNQHSECVVRGVAKDSGDQTQTSQPIARVGKSGFRPTTAPYGKVPLTTLEDGRHTYSSDDSIAPYKPKFFKDKKIRDKARAQSLAKLILGMKAKDAFTVKCEVAGFVSREGRVWSIDTVARVVIGSIGLDENMWILSRELKADRQRGQITSLELIPLNSLQLGDVPT